MRCDACNLRHAQLVLRSHGQIEKTVRDARHRLWQSMPPFKDLDSLNDWLEQRCRELWEQTPHGSEPGTIEHHKTRVRFFSTVDLVNALEPEKDQGRSGQIAARLVHADLVIFDELGYLPFSTSGGDRK